MSQMEFCTARRQARGSISRLQLFCRSGDSRRWASSGWEFRGLSALEGMYFAMYFVSVRVLLSYGPLRKSRANIFMFCITTSMFISGTVAIVLGSGLISQSVPFILQDIDPSFGAWSDRTTDTVTDIFAVITRLNPILSDIVCAWRAVVIWRWDRRVILILTTCILGTLAAAGYDLKLAIEVHPGSQDEQGLQEGTVALVIVGPMLGTNLLSTSLIAWKAWEYRQHVRAHLRLGSPSQRVEKLLALLIESGFIYCLIWIIYLLTAFGVLPGSGSYIVNIFMLYLSCMYPTAITIIVPWSRRKGKSGMLAFMSATPDEEVWFEEAAQSFLEISWQWLHLHGEGNITWTQSRWSTLLYSPLDFYDVQVCTFGNRDGMMTQSRSKPRIWTLLSLWTVDADRDEQRLADTTAHVATDPER
ncbi:hypothetical protein BC834DRAFT_1036327 [Gloeopeniophorella convolvens]|nr:hypothetical protein BC834DRAFT_1036327 [Gloeopeniophorella convolvens]